MHAIAILPSHAIARHVARTVYLMCTAVPPHQISPHICAHASQVAPPRDSTVTVDY